MGNVFASSSPPPAAVPIPLGPSPTAPEEEKILSPSPLSKDPSLINPGPMEELHRKCKEVFPMTFEGAKFMVNKGVSQHFQISHTLNISSVNPAQSGYKFGANYVGTNQISPSEAFPIFAGDIDPSGTLNANIIHLIQPRILGRFVSKIQASKVVGMQGSMDYKGDDFTASLTAANTDIVTNSGVLVGHYLQSVTKNVALGAELAYQYGPQVPGFHATVINVAGRYTCDQFTASGTVGASGVHACYYQKCSDTLQIGVELETNLRIQESTAQIGYQIDLPKANCVFKGMVDTSWTVGAVLEKRLLPMPFTLSLSGTMNHRNGQFRLGCGFVLG
ncbi:mitochondrial import receptor subunit TOM40 homolog 1-like [Cloeon dipterum]|uniref:mitochondrial import receptor subunit TOM40 homolog 1-like n=1 Tax=Cloeon dipterum TaxID=197152 RepID=UPI0032206B90